MVFKIKLNTSLYPALILIQSARISASYLTCVAQILSLNPVMVTFIAFWQKQFDALCPGGKVFNTRDGESIPCVLRPNTGAQSEEM